MKVIFLTYLVWPLWAVLPSDVIPVRGKKFMHKNYTISSDTILLKNAFQTNL